MYLIGLTGNLGCGKSTVRRMLEQLGARGIDADLLAHAALERGTPAWNALVKTFGDEILRPNGEVDRQALGKMVFTNSEALSRLEQIVHPAVGELVKQELQESDNPVVVLEAIKLVESGMNRWCDALWVVTCSPEGLLQRVARERNLSPADAQARLEFQSPQDEKAGIADVVIDNSGDRDATLQQVQRAWTETVHPERARDKRDWLEGAKAPSAPQADSASIPAPSELGKSEPKPVPGPAETPPVETTSAPTPIAPPPQMVEPKDQVIIPGAKPMEHAQRISHIQVRRARRWDVNALSFALAQAEGRTAPLSQEQTMKKLGASGYRIALADNRVVALAAWEAENLVAVTRDLWAESLDLARVAMPPLLQLIEQDANALACEVSILLVSSAAPAYIGSQAHSAGYQVRQATALHRVWAQVVEDRLQPSDLIWVKPLRATLVTKPVE